VVLIDLRILGRNVVCNGQSRNQDVPHDLIVIYIQSDLVRLQHLADKMRATGDTLRSAGLVTGKEIACGFNEVAMMHTSLRKSYEYAHFPTPNLQVQVDGDEAGGLMV
jgi:hypothetical protein